MASVLSDTLSDTERLPSPRDLCLPGKRVAMVFFSSYPADPRPRRAAEALLAQGVSVDLISLADVVLPQQESRGSLNILRIPITHRRGGKISYLYNYSAFILACSLVLAWRSLRHRYDLVYVHNMPDVLVLSALVPKALGARVILDQHDPMPELMMTIFNLNETSRSVRLLRWLEKWSIARADLVLTVNEACRRIFGSRSCALEKIGVVMNSPDETIFPFRAAQPLPSITDVQQKPFVIMYHGSLVERNGLDLAVAALAAVRSAVPTAELRIYGRETSFLRNVMTQVRSKGLAYCVSYLGPRSLEELVGEIEACDVGVIPNHSSAFAEINTPTRIFEYLALGKPVIAPRAAGITDYFDEGSIVFFELGCAEGLARSIEYVFFHPRDVTEIVIRGQRVYREHCWQTEKQRLIGLVDGLLSDRTGSSHLARHIRQTEQDAVGRL